VLQNLLLKFKGGVNFAKMALLVFVEVVALVIVNTVFHAGRRSVSTSVLF
jgi:hypothetical protein